MTKEENPSLLIVPEDSTVNMDAPKQYADRDAIARRDVDEIMREFRDEIKEMHGTIADIGCGPANVARHVMLRHLPDDAVIVCMDKSPVMLKYAQENNKDEKRMSFLQLDIETTELPMNVIGNYDHAIITFVFHWCQKTDVMLKNIYKLLRPGGMVLSISLSDISAFYPYLKYEKNSKYTVYMQNATRYVSPHHGIPNPSTKLKKDLEEAGFEVLHCTDRSRTFTFEKLDHWIDLIMATTAFLSQMPEDMQKEWRNDVTRVIKEKYAIDVNDHDANGRPFVEKYATMVALFKKPLK